MSNGINEPEIPVPCFECRPVAYAQFMERRKPRTGENIAVKLFDKATKLQTDPMKVLEDSIEQLGKEALQGNGQSKQMWAKLIRVQLYLIKKGGAY